MKQGEIWEVNLDPTVGAEIKKKRPCVIINDDAIGILPLKIVVPITEWNKDFEEMLWFVKLTPNAVNNLKKISAIDCFQVRSVSELRLVRNIGVIQEKDLSRIKISLKAIFDID